MSLPSDLYTSPGNGGTINLMKQPAKETTWEDRLSRIETQWTVVQRAHGDTVDGKLPAKESVLHRYRGAVLRYLIGAVGDAEEAEELSQEFAIRFLRGDFHRVSPDRGRFRQYVKSVLINLVNDHFKARKNAERQLSPKAPDPAVGPETLSEGPSFEDCLREDLLNAAWSALQKDNVRYHAALLMRVENPDLSSRELAEQLTESLDSEVTAAWVRKNLERARTKFAQILVQQVENSGDCSTHDELRSELESLSLMRYCRTAFESRTGNKEQNDDS